MSSVPVADITDNVVVLLVQYAETAVLPTGL